MEQKNKSSFDVNICFEQQISRFGAIHLSLSQYDPPKKKNLTDREHTKVARKTPLEYLTQLISDGRVADPDRPLIILSTRNVLANLRCIGYIKGFTKTPISVSEEYELLLSASKRNDSRRK